MFGFLEEMMANTYENRKVARYEKDDVFVDTCRITDSEQPYETAVAHPKYNDNKIVIVEMYNTEEEAKRGHSKWVKKMTSKKLPKTLKDVSTSDVVEFAQVLGVNLNEEYQKC